jgi:hypothetical protein
VNEWLDTYPRFVLEGIVLLLCFQTLRRTTDPADKSAAWAIIGLVVASIIRNLATPS